jgi:uncharacterized protein
MNLVLALQGGMLIGAAALLLYAAEGKIAGISGIVFSATGAERAWKLVFLAGLIGGGWLAVDLGAAMPEAPLPTTTTGLGPLALAGVVVGVGTRLSKGCTSGHGVCGLARLSPRSLAAVITFMGVGMLTATLLHYALR